MLKYGPKTTVLGSSRLDGYKLCVNGDLIELGTLRAYFKLLHAHLLCCYRCAGVCLIMANSMERNPYRVT